MRCRGMVLVLMRLCVLMTAVASRSMIEHGATDEKISPVEIRVGQVLPERVPKRWLPGSPPISALMALPNSGCTANKGLNSTCRRKMASLRCGRP